MERPDDVTWEWAKDLLGDCEIVHRFAHDHGYSRLWRLRSRSGHVWLKMHNFPIKWAGEVHALTQWTPSIGQAPSVLAHRVDSNAVLLSEVDGTPAEEVDLDATQEARMWSEAGEWLRKLHARPGEWLGCIHPDGSPNGPITTDAMAFTQRTFDQRLREGQEMGLLDSSERAFIEMGVRDWLPSLVGETPIAIHRDYSPRNWMVRRDGSLTAVIDFEHARWDVRAADLNRWWDYEFIRNPMLKEAFFEAYGQPDERLQLQMRTMRLLNATGGVVWATKVNDPPFAERNRQALHRMMREFPGV